MFPAQDRVAARLKPETTMTVEQAERRLRHLCTLLETTQAQLALDAQDITLLQTIGTSRQEPWTALAHIAMALESLHEILDTITP
jgi:hypothetical protein